MEQRGHSADLSWGCAQGPAATPPALSGKTRCFLPSHWISREAIMSPSKMFFFLILFLKGHKVVSMRLKWVNICGSYYNRTWCTVRVQKVVAKLKTCSVNTESWLRSTWTKHTCKLRSKLTQTRRGGGLTASITGLVTDTEAQRAGPGACAAKGCFLPTYLFFYRYFLHDPRRILKGKESGYL